MAGMVPPGTAMLVQASAAASATKINEVGKKVDYMNLPCPIPYEELHREALSSVLYLCSPLSFNYLLTSFFLGTGNLCSLRLINLPFDLISYFFLDSSDTLFFHFPYVDSGSVYLLRLCDIFYSGLTRQRFCSRS